MEFDELKTMWKGIEHNPKSNTEIREMLRENKHPVLKGIRKQFTIEITAWVLFLTCYYTMFDGAAKHLPVNITLILAVLIPLIHNIYGYNFAKYVSNAPTLKNALEDYLHKMKVYMVRSILSRILFICGLMLFFSCNIDFNTRKYFLLSAITLLLIIFQATFLYKIWTKRIDEIRRTIRGLS